MKFDKVIDVIDLAISINGTEKTKFFKDASEAICILKTDPVRRLKEIASGFKLMASGMCGTYTKGHDTLRKSVDQLLAEMEGK